jgi:UDP-GlcNAc:undecaprenyl-phosphate/decaprenyl-phosphate GlcNAc-1-phosphate transferase
MIYVWYLGAFALAALISRVLAPPLIHLAHQTNLLDHPTERKKHKKPTPFFGGLIIFASFWTVAGLGLLAAYFFPSMAAVHLQLPWIFEDILPWLPQISGVFLGSLVILLIGLWDDRFNLPPFIKFIGQSVAAIILLYIGLRVNLVHELGWFGYFVTYAWIILLMNAFNFIDSIDGHSLGIALISSFIFFFITQIIHQVAVALLVITFTGALYGFFPFNFKPARCFLGDNGSLFIGYMMSVITLLCRYSTPNTSQLTPLIPILMFGVPLYDTLSVIVVRLLRGIPPWKGDRNHLAHRLVRLGMGERTAAMASYFIALTLGLVALLSTQITTNLGSFLLILLFVCIISIIALLEFYAAIRISMIEKLAGQKKRRREDIREAEDTPRKR